MSDAYMNEYKEHLIKDILKRGDGAYFTSVKLMDQQKELQAKGHDLPAKKLAYLTQALHKSREYYERGLDFALEHEDEVGEWLTCKIMNSLGISYARMGRRGLAKTIRDRYRDYLRLRAEKWGLDEYMINLLDLVDFLSKERIRRLRMLNPHLVNRAMEIVGRDMNVFQLTDDVVSGEDGIGSAVPMVTAEDAAEIFSRVPPANIADIASVMATVAMDSDNLVCKTREDYPRYYKLLLNWPMRKSLYKVISTTYGEQSGAWAA